MRRALTEVADVHAHLAPATLRHLLVLFGSMLKHANRMGSPSILPPIDKPKVRIHGRDYRYLRATDEEGPDVFALHATAIYTGMSQGELAVLQLVLFGQQSDPLSRPWIRTLRLSVHGWAAASGSMPAGSSRRPAGGPTV